jgi:hypothetical protein
MEIRLGSQNSIQTRVSASAVGGDKPRGSRPRLMEIRLGSRPWSWEAGLGSRPRPRLWEAFIPPIPRESVLLLEFFGGIPRLRSRPRLRKTFVPPIPR